MSKKALGSWERKEIVSMKMFYGEIQMQALLIDFSLRCLHVAVGLVSRLTLSLFPTRTKSISSYEKGNQTHKLI